MQCRTVYVDKTEQVPIKTCKTEMVDKCEPYNVPNTEVVSEPMTGTQTFGNIKVMMMMMMRMIMMIMMMMMIKVCTIAEEQAEHCVNLPTKEICEQRMVRGSLALTRSLYAE